MDDWAYPDQYESELYPLHEIDTIPVTLMIATNDYVCRASTAYEAAEQINSVCNVVTLDADHGFPALSMYNNVMADELDLSSECQGYIDGYATIPDNSIATAVSSTLLSLFLLLLY